MVEIKEIAAQLKAFAEKKDFEGALKYVTSPDVAATVKTIRGTDLRDAMKRTTDNRTLLAFISGVEFERVAPARAFARLEKLVRLTRANYVLNATWGLGKVKGVDDFYRRMTVDFLRAQKGHQFTFAAAADVLDVAPDDHILVRREADAPAVEAMLRDDQGEFVKAMIASYGKMPLVKLEDLAVRNGFVKSVNWKSFWEKARAKLRADKCVVIPTRRTDSIEVLKEEETYGDSWLSSFAAKTDPKLILADVREYLSQKKAEEITEEARAALGNRLQFAIVAARNVDDALYARLACQITALGYPAPSAREMRDYLWERKRYVKAAAALPAREVGAMIAFLAADDEAKERLYAAIPQFCFTAVAEIVSQFGDQVKAGTEDVYPCREAIGRYMREPKAPATLVALLVGKVEQFGKFVYENVKVDGKDIRTLKDGKLWKELPPLITLLTHAIALGEGRQAGETLKMQNIVRRLFGDRAWLEKMFSLLSPGDQALFFERFQASIAWEASTHHTTVVRMIRIVPALERHLVKVEKKKEYGGTTSFRSFALRKQEYLKLINEDMPENVRKIEFAKGFGDLSENAEYQYAKDEQRALMQKQSLMQADLERVKPSDFADATTDEVMPGVTVVISAPDGEKTYTILGEWDNDLERGVISSKTKLAENMLGKKAGDSFELPTGEDGVSTFATIREIRALSEELREWMKLPEGVGI